MSEEKYVDFIEEIFRLTKEAQISWKYLDSNKSLYEGMDWTKTSSQFGMFSGEKKTVSPDFDREDSFYSNIGGTNIVLLVYGNGPATLYVVPSTYKKVVRLDADEYGEQITRLLNLVQTKFPDGEKFISDFLSNKSE